jgi:hypothetical protein
MTNRALKFMSGCHIHMLEKIRVSWIRTQAIIERINLDMNNKRRTFINSLFKPSEGAIFIAWGARRVEPSRAARLGAP